MFFCSGDVFGVLVTYFGETCSTVIFLKNGYPVATRCLALCSYTFLWMPCFMLTHVPLNALFHVHSCASECLVSCSPMCLWMPFFHVHSCASVCLVSYSHMCLWMLCFMLTHVPLNALFHVPMGSPSCGGDVVVCVYDTNSPSLPTPLFYSIHVSVSVFMALSTVFLSINSPDNSPLSQSVLLVLFLPCWAFQLYISLWKSPSALI